MHVNSNSDSVDLGVLLGILPLEMMGYKPISLGYKPPGNDDTAGQRATLVSFKINSFLENVKHFNENLYKSHYYQNPSTAQNIIKVTAKQDQ